MSLDWTITTDDLEIVLAEHCLNLTPDIADWVFEEKDRIMTVAESASDQLDKQVNACLSEIENILIENKIAYGPKKFY